MLDESMFEDIHEIAENSAYLKAVEEKDVCLDMLEQLPPYDSLKELEVKLEKEDQLTFKRIFNEPTGYYLTKCFLIADYAGDKAIFIKDVEAYRNMRFESARRKIAKLLYQRFVAQDETFEFKKGSSVFQIIQSQKKAPQGPDEKDQKESSLQSVPNTTQPTTSPSSAPNQPATSAPKPSDSVSMLQMGTRNNAIGVYGKCIQTVKDRVNKGDAPKELFDEVAQEVMNDLQHDVFPRFKKK